METMRKAPTSTNQEDMETMKNAPRLTNQEDEGEKSLDAKVWGQLQEYLPLHTIYKKLSHRELFRLRLVSKEWNHSVLQWKRIVPKRSFVTIARILPGFSHYYILVKVIVGYNITSGEFKLYRQCNSRLCHVCTHVPPFEVEGLVVCHNPDALKERSVFNLHTSTWHAIPTGPEQSETLSVCGLLVDTTVRPYTFKLIEGNQNFRTQIYDSKSRSWSISSSHLPSSTMQLQLNTEDYHCICHNGIAYMSTGKHTILKYSLEDDKWTEVEVPKGDEWRMPSQFSQENSLGVWGGRIFTIAENHKKQRVSVWELVDSEGKEWVEYACMPKEQYEWLWKQKFDGGETCMRSFFSGSYLLVCSWWWTVNSADEFALFNFATKVWQKVDVPRVPAAIYDKMIADFQ